MWRYHGPLGTGVLLVQMVLWLQVLSTVYLHRYVSGLELALHETERLERVPSCIHSFGRIEVSNSDTTDCLIRSIRFGHEPVLESVTSPFVSSSTSVTAITSRMLEDFGDLAYVPKYHVSWEPQVSLTLAPGQVVAMPIPFLPRFPTRIDLAADYVASSRGRKRDSILTPWQQAEREEWLGSYTLRSNQPLFADAATRQSASSTTTTATPSSEEYQVAIDFRVDTENHGIHSMRIQATSDRDNPFGLPDTLHFQQWPILEKEKEDHDSSTFLSSSPSRRNSSPPSLSEAPTYISDHGIRILDRVWTGKADEPPKDSNDCYDVYIRHPGDAHGINSHEPWQISEVLLSKPEKVSLHLYTKYLDNHASTTTSGTMTKGTGKHVITSWTIHDDESSPRSIPPDNMPHYLVTVCPTPATERDAAADEYVYSLDVLTTRRETYASAGRDLGYLLIRSEAPTLFVKLEAITRNTHKTPPETWMSQGEVFSLVKQMDPSLSASPLQSTPQSIDVALLSSMEGSPRKIIVSLANPTSRNVTIMGAALAFHDSAATALANYGVRLKVKFNNPDGNWSIPSGQMKSLVELIISMEDTTKSCPSNSTTLQGRLLIQGSLKETDQDEWLHNIRLNPQLDLDALLEIPVSIHFFEGAAWFQLDEESSHNRRDLLVTSRDKSGAVVVEGAFFPKDGLAGNSNMTLGLRLVSSLPERFQLGSVALVEGKGQTDCDSFLLTLKPGYSNTGENNLILGKIDINYIGYNESSSSPLLCSLAVELQPNIGKILLPLMIFSGKLSVISSLASATAPVLSNKFAPSYRKSESYRAEVGYSEILEWMSKTVPGKSFQSYLIEQNGQVLLDREERLKSFFAGFLEESELKPKHVQPVVLSVGVVGAGEIGTFPLYIANRNPVSVSISLSKANVTGFSVKLGRDKVVKSVEGKSFADVIMRSWALTKDTLGRNASAQNDDWIRRERLESLFYFLKTSTLPRSFLNSFNFRDAIYLDRGSETLYPDMNFARRTQQVDSSTFYINDTDCALACPLSQLEFNYAFASSENIGPTLLSTDGSRVARLSRCKGEETDFSLLPPGGVARFEVTFTAPPEELIDREVKSFLTTGMVLSTDQDEIIPILLSFRVARGSLILTPFHEKKSERAKGRHVWTTQIAPAFFKSNYYSSFSRIRIPSKSRSQPRVEKLLSLDGYAVDSDQLDEGLPLYARSSFDHDIELLNVESCNPWFRIKLRNHTEQFVNDPFVGVKIGVLQHEIPCENPTTLTTFHSFHGCALNWIHHWSDLSRKRCGSDGVLENSSKSSLEGRQHVAVAKAHNQMLQISAWSFSSHRDINSAEEALGDDLSRYFDGYLAPALVTISATLWNIWRHLWYSDLFTMSSDLRATVEPDISEGWSEQEVSLPLRSVSVVSKLRPPSLLDPSPVAQIVQPAYPFAPSIIKVPSALVGSPVSFSIPLYNPTDVSVRVRLAIPLAERDPDDDGPDFGLESQIRDEYLTTYPSPYVQGPLHSNQGLDQMNQHWWDGSGSFYFPDFHGNLIRAHHNVSVRAGSHAFVGLVSPSLMSNSAFLYGCGIRCGVRDESMKIDAGRDTQRSSSIGASSVGGVTLIGHSHEASADDQGWDQKSRDISLPAGASIHSGRQGPVAFGIPRPALEEIVIGPNSTGEIGPIYFRPPGKTQRIGGVSQDDKFFYSLVFLENSLTGLERVILKGKSLWESVEFLDMDPEEGEDRASDVELRHGMPSLIFPGTLLPPFPTSDRTLKEFKVRNNGDIPVYFHEAYLSDEVTPRFSDDLVKTCEHAGFELANCSLNGSFSSIRLGPGDMITFFVTHRPSCVKRVEFIGMKLLYGDSPDEVMPEEKRQTNAPSRKRRLTNRRNWPFRRPGETLLIGYDMSQEAFSHCVATNEILFIQKNKDPVVLKPENQTLSLSRLARTVRESKVSQIRHFSLKAAAFFVYMCLCFFIILGIVLIHDARRVAANALEEYSNRLDPVDVYSLGRNQGSFISTVIDTSTHAELEAVSRSRLQKIILPHLRAAGSIHPQCLSAEGVFQRGRIHGLSGRGHVSSKERSRTVGDALFEGMAEDQLHGGLLPLNMDWRVAVAKGITSERSFKKIQGSLRTHHLLIRRSRTRKLDPVPKTKHNDDNEDVGVALSLEERSGDTECIADEDSQEDELDSNLSPDIDTAMPDFPKGLNVESTDSSQRSSFSKPEFTDQHEKLGGEDADPGFKTIKTEKAIRGRSRKSVHKKSTFGNRAGTSRLDRGSKPANATKKISTDLHTSSVQKPVRVVAPASTQAVATNERGWAYVAALANQATPRSSEVSTLLRPPPGLTPPPGFATLFPPSVSERSSSPRVLQNEGFSLDFSVGRDDSIREHLHSHAHSDTSSHSGDNVYAPESPLLSPMYMSRDNSVEHLPSLSMLLGETAQPFAVSQKPSAPEDDFDVLDFLDGILNDSSNRDINHSLSDAGVQPTTMASIVTSNGMTEQVGVEPAVPFNPWAGGEGDSLPDREESRAVLYGIALNEHSGPPAAVGEDPIYFPLLTPQALLEGTREEEEKSPLFTQF